MADLPTNHFMMTKPGIRNTLCHRMGQSFGCTGGEKRRLQGGGEEVEKRRKSKGDKANQLLQ